MTPRELEIRSWLVELTAERDAFELELIAGGASPRRFYRIRDRFGSERTQRLLAGAPTAIVMDVPPDTPDVAFAAKLGRPWPFLEVRDLLEQAGVRVPRLLVRACERNLLLVEDLGPTLSEHLATHPSERESLYRLAVEDLARAQRALDPLPATSIVRERAFDGALLGWEIDHFREWGLEARGIVPTDAQAATFRRARERLVALIAELERGFVHRDYQSRNLLVVSGNGPELGWVDFQDALLGPRAYDLVALLCDSYQPFERDFTERRLDDFARERGLAAAERQKLGREFDLVSVQRKLKDAGRFVFIERKRGDPSFLPFFEPTLGMVRQALARLADVPELVALAGLLDELGV